MTNETEAANLLPCPSCGGDAELDTMQAFAKFQSSGGGIGNAVAVYCLKCYFTCSCCHDDFDGSLDELIHLVVENWNTRADLSDAKGARIAELEAERDAVAARLERALITGSLNLARAEAAEAKLAKAEACIEDVHRDCKLRAVKGVVPLGSSCWENICATLAELKVGKDG